MKIQLTLYLLFFLAANYVYGQHEISGQFIDENSEPTGYLQVGAFIEDSLITGSVTDENGEFSFFLPDGTYKISADLFGENLYSKELTVDEPIDLGTLSVKANVLLETVVVTGRKDLIERKVDRLVFNVQNSISASSGNAMDALRKAPGVIVQNDAISMIGKDGVGVMVDGRMVQVSGEDLSDFLESIASDGIQSIEVITLPPAKYEAEGNSGLINIILKKGRKNSWSSSIRTTYTQTTYPIYASGVNFHYNKNKTRLLIDVSGRAGHKAIIEKAQVFYPNQTWVGQTDRKDKRDFLSGRVAYDYDISEKTSVGIQYLGMVRNPDIEDENTTRIHGLLSNRLDSTIVSEGSNDKALNNHSFNVHFASQLDTMGRKINVDLDYFTFHATQDRTFQSRHYLSDNEPTNSFLSNINKSRQNISNYSAKIDIEHPTNWANLSYGAKASFIYNENPSDFFNTISGSPVLDSAQSRAFEYYENTQSAYVNTSKKIGEKWETQVGLRVENTQTKGVSKTLNETNRNNYIQFFPTAYLTYTNNDNSFSANYGRRITRPAYWELDPFRWYTNANTYSEGNPFLQPSYTTNLNLSHSYKNKLTSGIFLMLTSNGFTQITALNPETNELAYIRRNYYDEYKFGVSESYLFNKYAWWESYNEVYLWYSEPKFYETQIDAEELNGWALYYGSSNSFMLNKSKTIRAELNFGYSVPAQGRIYKVGAIYNLDAGLKLFLLDKKLQVTLSVADILRKSVSDVTTFTSDIRQVYNIYPDNRYFRLSAKYSFGNKKTFIQKRQFGNEEEKRRT